MLLGPDTNQGLFSLVPALYDTRKAARVTLTRVKAPDPTLWARVRPCGEISPRLKTLSVLFDTLTKP